VLIFRNSLGRVLFERQAADAFYPHSRHKLATAGHMGNALYRVCRVLPKHAMRRTYLDMVPVKRRKIDCTRNRLVDQELLERRHDKVHGTN